MNSSTVPVNAPCKANDTLAFILLIVSIILFVGALIAVSVITNDSEEKRSLRTAGLWLTWLCGILALIIWFLFTSQPAYIGLGIITWENTGNLLRVLAGVGILLLIIHGYAYVKEESKTKGAIASTVLLLSGPIMGVTNWYFISETKKLNECYKQKINRRLAAEQGQAGGRKRATRRRSV